MPATPIGGTTPFSVRRGVRSLWISRNTLLKDGELGLVLDNSTRQPVQLLIGDGATRYNQGTLPDLIALSGSGVDLTPYALDEDVQAIIASAPTSLNNLNKLAAAMANDPAFYATVATAINGKVQSGPMVSSANTAPNGTAVQNAIAAVVAGSTDPVPTTFSPAIQLDKTQGRDMGLNSIASAVALSVSSSPAAQPGGNLAWTIVMTGTGSLDTSAFKVAGDTIVNVAGNSYQLGFIQTRTGRALLLVTALDAIDLTAPAPQTAHVDNASPSVVRLPFNEVIFSNGIANGDVAVTGHTVTGVAIAGVELQITVTPAFGYGETRTVSVAAGKLKDGSNNVCGAIAAQPITDNIAQPVPGAISGLTNSGSTTASAVGLGWTAPTIDSGHGAPTDYRVEYRLAGSGSYTVFADGVGTGTSASVTGLTAGTSYDFRVTPLNAAGDGPVSSVFTRSTLVAQVTGLTVGTMTPSTAPLSWSAVAGATAYLVEFKKASDSGWTTFGSPSASPATVTGLDGSTSYNFRVSGINGSGNGTPSATSTASTTANTTIMSDGFSNADRNIDGWVPDINNAEGNAWVAPTGGGAPVIKYGTLLVIQSGSNVGARYAVTSRKNYTLTLEGVYFNNSSANYRVYMRDTPGVVNANTAGYSATYVSFNISGDTVTIKRTNVINGVDDSTGPGAPTTLATITGVPTNGSNKIRLIMASDDTCQVQFDNGSGAGGGSFVNAGAAFPINVAGANFGFRIAADDGAMDTVTAA